MYTCKIIKIKKQSAARTARGRARRSGSPPRSPRPTPESPPSCPAAVCWFVVQVCGSMSVVSAGGVGVGWEGRGGPSTPPPPQNKTQSLRHVHTHLTISLSTASAPCPPAPLTDLVLVQNVRVELRVVRLVALLRSGQLPHVQVPQARRLLVDARTYTREERGSISPSVSPSATPRAPGQTGAAEERQRQTAPNPPNPPTYTHTYAPQWPPPWWSCPCRACP